MHVLTHMFTFIGAWIRTHAPKQRAHTNAYIYSFLYVYKYDMPCKIQQHWNICICNVITIRPSSSFDMRVCLLGFHNAIASEWQNILVRFSGRKPTIHKIGLFWDEPTTSKPSCISFRDRRISKWSPHFRQTHFVYIAVLTYRRISLDAFLLQCSL